MFTPVDVIGSARDLAPEFQVHQVDPEVLARALNASLRKVLRMVIDADPDRLAQAYAVPAEVVALDPVDLTALVVEEGVTTGQREWLHIEFIDALDSSGEVLEEVVVVPVAERNRASREYAYLNAPVAVAVDQMRKLRKLGGWNGVDTLEIFGVLSPTRLTGATLDDTSIEFDYPGFIEDAVAWELLTRIAMHIGVVGPRLLEFRAGLAEALQAAEDDAQDHYGNRVDTVPYINQ